MNYGDIHCSSGFRCKHRKGHAKDQRNFVNCKFYFEASKIIIFCLLPMILWIAGRRSKLNSFCIMLHSKLGDLVLLFKRFSITISIFFFRFPKVTPTFNTVESLGIEAYQMTGT